ncbi:DUF2752 domain-containing protein [Salinactinospora qingdaonensis]|uniref:DUF2752 domain-containing protein n=1 Tax=Salinactinospora qingdaonensis TaxID=702744 RepID=A0ABP7FTM5_9ACTN
MSEPLATRLQRRLHPATAPLLLGVAALAGTTLIHFVDPNEAGHYPTCPWLMITGTFCPGCGTMRCIHALTNLDVVGAVEMNVVTVLVLPFLLAGYARWLWRSLRPAVAAPRHPPKTINPFWLWLLLAGIVGFWIVRNLSFLPFAAFLAPG